MKALVVDDDPIVCVVLTDALAKFGFREVLTADNGERAATLFTEHEAEITLVCSDLNMPERDGIEFMQFLANRRFRPQVILVSGAHATVRKSAELLAKARNIDVIGTLRKPIAHADLEELRPVVCSGMATR